MIQKIDKNLHNAYFWALILKILQFFQFSKSPIPKKLNTDMNIAFRQFQVSKMIFGVLIYNFGPNQSKSPEKLYFSKSDKSVCTMKLYFYPNVLIFIDSKRPQSIKVTTRSFPLYTPFLKQNGLESTVKQTKQSKLSNLHGNIHANQFWSIGSEISFNV